MSWGLRVFHFIYLLINDDSMKYVSHLIRLTIDYNNNNNNETKNGENATRTRAHTHNEIFSVLIRWMQTATKYVYVCFLQTNLIIFCSIWPLWWRWQPAICRICVFAFIFRRKITILCVMIRDARTFHPPAATRIGHSVDRARTHKHIAEEDCKWDVIIMVVDERRVIMSQWMLLR